MGEQQVFTASELENGVILVTASDAAEPKDAFAHIRLYLSQWPDRNFIWDLSKAVFQETHSRQLRRLVFEAKDHIPPERSRNRTAFVADGEVGYGMCRMMALLAKDVLPTPLGAFRDLGTALEWVTGADDEIDADLAEQADADV